MHSTTHIHFIDLRTNHIWPYCFRHCAASEKRSVQVLPHRVHNLDQAQERHVKCTCRINNKMTANMLIGLFFFLIDCLFCWVFPARFMSNRKTKKHSEEWMTSVSEAEVQWLWERQEKRSETVNQKRTRAKKQWISHSKSLHQLLLQLLPQVGVFSCLKPLNYLASAKQEPHIIFKTGSNCSIHSTLAQCLVAEHLKMLTQVTFFLHLTRCLVTSIGSSDTLSTPCPIQAA